MTHITCLFRQFTYCGCLKPLEANKRQEKYILNIFALKFYKIIIFVNISEINFHKKCFSPTQHVVLVQRLPHALHAKLRVKRQMSITTVARP